MMNKRLKKKNLKTEQEVWYIFIDRGIDGTKFNPQPRKGYIKNNKFIDIDTGEKFKLKSIKDYVFVDLLKAADYIDEEYDQWCLRQLQQNY